jgi:hypothetical protein
MQLLHEPVPRLRGTFKVAYASNCHHSYVQRARRKELNPCTKSWSIETLHKPRGVRSMRLEVEHLRFYTRLASESDSKAAKSEMHSSPDKSRRETKKEVLSGWRGRWGGSDGPMQLLHEPVPRLRGTFKVAYASNCHHIYVQRARRKELNPCAKSWSIETLHKNNFWVRRESRKIREVEFARQK